MSKGYEIADLPIDQVDNNAGQIPGLPKNPRYIRNDRYEALLKSIKDFPEMLHLREILVIEHEGRYVAIGGNMRLIACRELEHETIPCKILSPDTPVERLREITIKDNNVCGAYDDDILANEWNLDELIDWGLELTNEFAGLDDDDEYDDDEDEYEGDENVEVVEDEPPNITSDKCRKGDIWQLGKHKLICGDSTEPETLERLMNGETADIVLTDPPYNVNYKEKEKDLLEHRPNKRVEEGDAVDIANDAMEENAFIEFLTKSFNNFKDSLKDGGAFYIWHSSTHAFEFITACRQAELQLRQVLIWNKNHFVLGRSDYQYKHEPCQPAGTMVLTTKGEKPIETLTEDDRVIAYNPQRGQVLGYKNGGYAIKTANRDYDGLMYTVNVDGKSTKATDNHMFSIRFNSKAKKNYCTYLMRRGNWWRVGITKAYDARQFGLKTRYNQEKADEMWILGVYSDKIEAQVAEQIITVKYGIPYTIWEFDRFAKTPNRTKEQIKKIYDGLDLDLLKQNAYRLLHDFGRSEKFPFINKKTKAERFSTRVTAKVHACNLVPEIMQLPIPREPAAHKNYEFVTIDKVSFEPFVGKVYSLSVQYHKHYIADGICVHNCLYGWKDGASHYFVDDRTQSTVYEDAGFEPSKMSKQELVELVTNLVVNNVATDVINENKPVVSELHPTMKPVKLFARLLKNSSIPGDICLDPFCGSGTSIIACEQLARKCYASELSVDYCNTIITRWEEFTHEKAELISRINN